MLYAKNSLGYQITGAQVASSTWWECPVTPRWNNADDIALWPEQVAWEAARDGRAGSSSSMQVETGNPQCGGDAGRAPLPQCTCDNECDCVSSVVHAASALLVLQDPGTTPAERPVGACGAPDGTTESPTAPPASSPPTLVPASAPLPSLTPVAPTTPSSEIEISSPSEVASNIVGKTPASSPPLDQGTASTQGVHPGVVAAGVVLGLAAITGETFFPAVFSNFEGVCFGRDGRLLGGMEVK
jgi:hypothetical protein